MLNGKNTISIYKASVKVRLGHCREFGMIRLVIKQLINIIRVLMGKVDNIQEHIDSIGREMEMLRKI